jgi:flagellar FliJ protein
LNRFRFNLESVLKFRKTKEDEKKREFGHTLGKLKNEERKLDDIIDSGKRHDEHIEKTAKGKLTIRNLINNFYYSRHIEAAQEAQKDVVNAAQAVTEEKRAELVDATKKRKVLDRLKERRFEEHTKAELKEEQGIIDDIAGQQFNRKNS